MPRLRTSPALAVALLALVIALSGTAYALTLPRNSVGTPQLKKNAVVSKKVKNDTLTGADIKESTLKPVAGSYSVAGIEFFARDAEDTVNYEGAGAISRAGGTDYFAVRLDVPNGALLSSISFHLTDSSAPATLAVALTKFDPSTGTATNLVFSPAAVVALDTGVHTATLPVLGDERVDTNKYAYYAQVDPSVVGNTIKVYGATVTWTP